MCRHIKNAYMVSLSITISKSMFYDIKYSWWRYKCKSLVWFCDIHDRITYVVSFLNICIVSFLDC